jgi:ABC-type lipoprotein release transport system permease subunit
MRRSQAVRVVLSVVLALATAPAPGFGQAKPGPTPAGAAVLHVRSLDGGAVPEALRERVRGVPNIGQVEPFLEASDGVRVIGVEPAPTLHLRVGRDVRVAVIVQGRGFETGDAPEALVVGKTFSQANKTALGLSIPAMLTKDHFPPLIVGGQGFAIIGIYTTGDPQADDQVLMLLPTAQTLLNQPGRVSGLYVAPASPGAVEEVAGGLRRALGGSVEVVTLPRRPQ